MQDSPFLGEEYFRRQDVLLEEVSESLLWVERREIGVGNDCFVFLLMKNIDEK